MVVAVLAGGCAAIGAARCPHSYADNRYRDTGTEITRYVVPTRLGRSPLGVPIGPGVDGPAVDAAFLSVSACLGQVFHPCAVHAVFIAPDWFTAPGTEAQVFPCKRGELCTGANQWPATVVMTPDMHALTWEVERMLLRDDPDKDGNRRCWQRAAP
jgi:hypothetical protein